jgi:Zn-dependent protease
MTVDQLSILPILLFSVIIHEIAHGWMALRLGDPTAKMMGRLTLNPIPHIDLVGSILVPLFSLIAAGQVFIAWAKPVPVNPMNFRNIRRDDVLVSVVGPLSNIVLALACTLLFVACAAVRGQAGFPEGGMADQGVLFLCRMFHGGIVLNIVLAVFNLIPVPPLDGSHVVASLLPGDLANRYTRIGFFGVFILILMMRVPVVNAMFSATVHALFTPFAAIINIFFG